jgi:hypothetical protein
MYYFGYGSNMLTPRLQARVPSATPVTTGRLRGYELRFHKQSQDGSGKCNIVSSTTAKACVYGVVFEISPVDLSALDEAEQRGCGYVRRDVTIHASSSINAFAYVAQPTYIDGNRLPYDWYHALVRTGARQHSLPSSYVAQIESVPSYPDPNPKRRRHHRQLLRETGGSFLTR